MYSQRLLQTASQCKYIHPLSQLTHLTHRELSLQSLTHPLTQQCTRIVTWSFTHTHLPIHSHMTLPPKRSITNPLTPLNHHPIVIVISYDQVHVLLKVSLSLSAALKDYKRVYERILEMNKRLDLARKQLQTCEEKERKLQKEMVKGPKEVGLTQDKLQQAVDAKNLAEIEREY